MNECCNGSSKNSKDTAETSKPRKSEVYLRHELRCYQNQGMYCVSVCTSAKHGTQSHESPCSFSRGLRVLMTSLEDGTLRLLRNASQIAQRVFGKLYFTHAHLNRLASISPVTTVSLKLAHRWHGCELAAAAQTALKRDSSVSFLPAIVFRYFPPWPRLVAGP